MRTEPGRWVLFERSNNCLNKTRHLWLSHWNRNTMYVKIDCISRQSDLFLNVVFFPLRLHDSMVIFDTANSSTVLFLRIPCCRHDRGGLASLTFSILFTAVCIYFLRFAREMGTYWQIRIHENSCAPSRDYYNLVERT